MRVYQSDAPLPVVAVLLRICLARSVEPREGVRPGDEVGHVCNDGLRLVDGKRCLLEAPCGNLGPVWEVDLYKRGSEQGVRRPLAELAVPAQCTARGVHALAVAQLLLGEGHIGQQLVFVDDAHQKLTQMGVKSFDWNVSGEDSVGRHISGWIIMSNIKKDLTKYDTPIILLHDSAGMDRTAEVLGDIIDYIRSQGYTFATLTDREEYLFPVSWR